MDRGRSANPGGVGAGRASRGFDWGSRATSERSELGVGLFGAGRSDGDVVPPVSLAPADPANTDTEASIASAGEVVSPEPWVFSPAELAVAERVRAQVEQENAGGPASIAPQSFEQLFREYERYVASIGNRILGSNNGVEDLVQEVFLVIYQEFHKLRDLGSVKAWLATITTRLAWRQLGRPWLYSKVSIAQAEEQSPLESPDASPETRADLAALIQRLGRLSPSQRKAWVLRFIDGETLPRIAELCECSQSTVQRRLREAGEVMLAPRSEPR